jgi:hypothetical protein
MSAIREWKCQRNTIREIDKMAENSGDSVYIELTADIVSAYVSNNSVPSAEIGNLIGQVFSALKRVSGGQAAAPAEPQKPAVPIKRSVTDEYIICREVGLAARLFDGGAEICRGPLATRQADGIGSAAPPPPARLKMLSQRHRRANFLIFNG